MKNRQEFKEAIEAFMLKMEELDASYILAASEGESDDDSDGESLLCSATGGYLNRSTQALYTGMNSKIEIRKVIAACVYRDISDKNKQP